MNFAVLTYEFVSDKPAGIPDVWPAEIKNLGDSIELPGDDWVLMTESEYNTYFETHIGTYNTWKNSYYTVDMNAVVNKKITASIEFGTKILIQFATENVLMGITASGRTIEIVQYLTNLRNYVITGSLYAAVTEIDNLLADPDLGDYSPFVTEARLNYYKDRLVAFLASL